MADNAASKRPGDAVDLNEEASPREKKMRASMAARDASSLAKMGERQVLGVHVPENIALGIMNVTEAAHLGSELGALLLGEWLFDGCHGLPKDPVRARPWLKKVVDGDCKRNILTDGPIAEAARMLRELDGAGD